MQDFSPLLSIFSSSLSPSTVSINGSSCRGVGPFTPGLSTCNLVFVQPGTLSPRYGGPLELCASLVRAPVPCVRFKFYRTFKTSSRVFRTILRALKHPCPPVTGTSKTLHDSVIQTFLWKGFPKA